MSDIEQDNTKYFYVTMVFDYADEFDVYGSFVCNEAKVETLKQQIKATFDKFDEDSDTKETYLYFGTNEAIEVSDYADFIRNVKFHECSKRFYDEFLAIHPRGFGHNMIANLIESYRD